MYFVYEQCIRDVISAGKRVSTYKRLLVAGDFMCDGGVEYPIYMYVLISCVRSRVSNLHVRREIMGQHRFMKNYFIMVQGVKYV